ncbi:MAG: RluA family pseudouridine synthase [Leptospiraceae bacterium]|nr:RluA family pseudouridine synthase [Leptospiraceae bacterium]MCP5499456.1 RluA family pseudouridine synthase [Leptospiraceae bacterium]
MILKTIVNEEFAGMRLDRFLSAYTGDDISRTSIQKWIKSGNIFQIPAKKAVKASYIVNSGDEFEIHIPRKKEIGLNPVEMQIPIVREWEDFLVINKPAGLASHGGPGDSEPSLVNGLLFLFKNLSSVGGEDRPGIVHRLDKPTSGLMIVAKNDRAHIALSRMFQEKTVYKRYYAWLIQAPRESGGRVESPIGRHPLERLKMCIRKDGRKAITNYKILKTVSSRKGRNYSLAEAEIETGRTHQIRVHFQSLGCPVVGDRLYSRSGDEFKKYGLLLFAQKLRFQHPFTGEEIEIELPFPSNFIEFEKDSELR